MKAFLVIDISNEFDVNDLLIDYCVHTKGEYKPIRKGGNYYLKPMPNKQSTNLAIGIDLVDGFKDGWNYGWNACIDEIIGDNNE